MAGTDVEEVLRDVSRGEDSNENRSGTRPTLLSGVTSTLVDSLKHIVHDFEAVSATLRCV